MKASLGAVVLVLGAAGFANASPAATGFAAATTAKPQTANSSTTDLSARRYRHYRGYAYQPYYYARPTYYRPYPYATPVPFFLGFGFGPSW
jgi:hypothetical protein